MPRTSIPTTMRSLVAPRRCDPSDYLVMDMPVPAITKPNQILVRVYASAFMTGDCQRAQGLPFGQKMEYPLPLGLEGSGVVAAVGSEVTRFRPGDAVYGLNALRPVFSEPESGWCSEYAVGPEAAYLHKPADLSFEDAASLAGVSVTAYQAIKTAMDLAGLQNLEGKTVFVPAALSSLGSIVVQFAKSVFGASNVVSTVSTPKMDLVDKYIPPGSVDKLIDYKATPDLTTPGTGVPAGSVDVMVNTQWDSMNAGIPLLDLKQGVYVTLAGIPHAQLLRDIMGPENVPFWLGWGLDLAQYWYSWKFRGTNTTHHMVSGNPGNREDLEKAGEAISEGKIKAVTRLVDLEDIERVRAECEIVNKGKGGIGKLVIRVRSGGTEES